MTNNPPINLWSSADHVRDYLERADSISHRTEGEAAMLEFIPDDAHRILDLGTGDGRLLALVKDHLLRKNLVKNELTRKDLIKRDLRRKSVKPDFMEHPRPETEAVAIDFSLSMLEAARQRFAADRCVERRWAGSLALRKFYWTDNRICRRICDCNDPTFSSGWIYWKRQSDLRCNVSRTRNSK